MYHTILVPLDGSPLSEQALPIATELARRSGATLHLALITMRAMVAPIFVEPPQGLKNSRTRSGSCRTEPTWSRSASGWSLSMAFRW